MIIIGLIGGLGNQLFQYSFARALSKELNEELLLDVTNVHGRMGFDIYGLSSFNIKGVIGNFPFFESEYLNGFFKLIYRGLMFLPFFKDSPFIRICLYYFESSYQKINFAYVQKNPHEFDPNAEIVFNSFEEIMSPSYFAGNFQCSTDSKNRLFISENFFKNYLDLIHEDLMYVNPLSDVSKKIIYDMNQFDSILLHVRLGDYELHNNLGVCSEEYYEKSIEIIASKLDNPKFFIFSNDMEGAKKILNINYPHVYVDFKETNELADRGNGELLKLMSSCKHFIIANSTLSWWAAFLGENKNKIIITPEPWFQNRRLMGAETIDNKKPIGVVNNYSKFFINSEKLICKLNEDEFSFKNLKFDKMENSFKILNSNKNSKIILKNKFNTENQVIIKISLESNCFNCFRIFFKTVENNNCDNKLYSLFYYEDDDFDHYFIMPKNAILDDLKIVPAYPFENEDDYVIIKSFEIKEINELD